MADPQQAAGTSVVAGPRPPLWRAALFGVCPECGTGSMFAGYIRFANRCAVCGLDFTRFNVGDGPAALLVMIVGAILLPAQLALHFKVHPPLIVHLILWPIVALALIIGGLRLAKGGLLASEHQRGGHEGRIADAPDGAATDAPDNAHD